MNLEERQAMSEAEAELRAIAQKQIAEIIEQWRAAGLTVADIEKRLGRRLPEDLRT